MGCAQTGRPCWFQERPAGVIFRQAVQASSRPGLPVRPSALGPPRLPLPVDWGCVVIASLLLLCIVTNTWEERERMRLERTLTVFSWGGGGQTGVVAFHWPAGRHLRRFKRKRAFWGCGMGAQATEGGGDLQPEGLGSNSRLCPQLRDLSQLPGLDRDDYDGHHTGLMCTHGALDTGLGGSDRPKGLVLGLPWQSVVGDSRFHCRGHGFKSLVGELEPLKATQCGQK